MQASIWLFCAGLVLLKIALVDSQRPYRIPTRTTQRPGNAPLSNQQAYIKYQDNFWGGLLNAGQIDASTYNIMKNLVASSAPMLGQSFFDRNNFSNILKLQENGFNDDSAFQNITPATPLIIPSTEETVPGPQFVGPPPTPEPIFLPKGLRGITWSNYINNSALIIPTEKYPDGFDPDRDYFLGFGNPDFQFESCTTSIGQPGKCRYFHFCAQEKHLDSLDNFLEDACLIGQDYIGVCCLKNSGIREPPQPPRPASVPSLSTPRTPSNTDEKPTEAKPPPKKQGCGIQKVDVTRVVGGDLTEEGEWPWMASIIRNGNRHFCGGALITNQHILTASHCFFRFQGNNISNFTVRLGEYDFRTRSTTEKDFGVAAIYTPSNFTTKTMKDDIAILKLRTKVNFTDYIQPICLPPSNVVYDGQSAYVTGWGSTSYGGHPSFTLLKALLPIRTQQECKSAYQRFNITDHQLCAGYQSGGKDSCQGDSGGPLMLRSGENRWNIIGIVSLGRGCGEPGVPGVYTRVSAYLDWIKATVINSTK